MSSGSGSKRDEDEEDDDGEREVRGIHRGNHEEREYEDKYGNHRVVRKYGKYEVEISNDKDDDD